MKEKFLSEREVQAMDPSVFRCGPKVGSSASATGGRGKAASPVLADSAKPTKPTPPRPDPVDPKPVKPGTPMGSAKPCSMVRMAGGSFDITKLVTSKQAADALQVSERTLRNYETQGFIAAIRLGPGRLKRFSPEQLAALQRRK
jgi:hypothetical protein